jgi:hypothetical protein
MSFPNGFGAPQHRERASIHPAYVAELQLIGIDDDGRSLWLMWSDVPGWMLAREVAPGQWAGIATYSERPPVRALPLAQWLLRESRFHWDIIEEAVEALRDSHPERFNDPSSGESEDVTAIHRKPRSR